MELTCPIDDERLLNLLLPLEGADKGVARARVLDALWLRFEAQEKGALPEETRAQLRQQLCLLEVLQREYLASINREGPPPKATSRKPGAWDYFTQQVKTLLTLTRFLDLTLNAQGDSRGLRRTTTCAAHILAALEHHEAEFFEQAQRLELVLAQYLRSERLRLNRGDAAQELAWLRDVVADALQVRRSTAGDHAAR